MFERIPGDRLLQVTSGELQETQVSRLPLFFAQERSRQDPEASTTVLTSTEAVGPNRMVMQQNRKR